MSSKARLSWPVLAIVGAAVLAVGAGTWGLVGLFRREKPQLSEILREADQELSRGAFLRTQEVLDAGFRMVRGEAAYLRLLKRELRVAEMTGSYAEFARRARDAASDLPGSGPLAMAATYGVLRGGHPEDVGAVLRKAPGRAELDGLETEAYLRGLVPGTRAPRLEGRLAALAELPGTDEPAALHTLAGLLGEPRLDLDAALVWAARGQLEEAFAALWPHRSRGETAEAALFVAFDAGRYHEAWELLGADPDLRRLPEQMVFRGDVAWLSGRPEGAAEQYQRAIEADPDYSWVPYLNLAALMTALGDAEGARLFHRRAFRRFPGQAEVVLAHARDLAEQGEGGAAQAILVGLLERNPGLEPEWVEARLLLLELEGARGSPALYQGRMWELFNRNPGNPELARSFCLYLLGLRDVQGAGAVLRDYARVHGEPYAGWYLELKGAVAVAEGDVEVAVGFFRDSLRLEANWRRRYNLALVLGAGQGHQDALEELILAETELYAAQGQIEAARFGALRSRVRSRIAEAQTHLGDHEAARREALYALDLDPGNHHARRVLRILEGSR